MEELSCTRSWIPLANLTMQRRVMHCMVSWSIITFSMIRGKRFDLFLHCTDVTYQFSDVSSYGASTIFRKANKWETSELAQRMISVHFYYLFGYPSLNSFIGIFVTSFFNYVLSLCNLLLFLIEKIGGWSMQWSSISRLYWEQLFEWAGNRQLIFAFTVNKFLP